MLTDSNEWAADFIGRSERFDQDFARIVAAINQRLPPGVEPLSVKSKPQSQNTNEVECSNEFQPRSRQPQPQGDNRTADQGSSQETAQADSGTGAAAQGAGGVQQTAPAGEGEGAAASLEASATEAGQQGVQQDTAAADQQQLQQQVLQQGDGGGQRRLLYGKLPGFLFAEENYCDKRKFYTERHATCFQQIARFYGGDIQRLGFGQLLGGDEVVEAKAPVLPTQ